MKQILKHIIVFILEIESRLVLKKYKPKIIAITGSVGKTSAKDAIYSVLSDSFFVRKSDKSFNSEIGIPLTILGCPNAWSSLLLWTKNIFEGFVLIVLKNHYPKWLILEVGADRPGDIKNITRWLKPDIVVVTRIPDVPVHVEFFASPADVLKEKNYLVKALKKDGILILNHDDENVMSLKQDLEHLITFGFKEGSNMQAANDNVYYQAGVPVGIRFRVDYKGNSVPIEINGVVGRQHIDSALAALSVGSSQNLNIVAMGQSLSHHNTPLGRMKLIEGINKSTIIDDSYNSSPIAAEEALNALHRMNTEGRKIAVLGDMLELGSYTAEEHNKVGKQAAGVADILMTVGVRSQLIGESAQENGMKKKHIHILNDSYTAGGKLKNIISAGDLVLIKGSQSVRMERIVEEIMEHPEK
ncbi:hypothetical protein IIB50_01565, partial [Patescibacteria group bacterium]|nr:hypothetical protein [Patescibacteria group bacterium]